MAPDSFANLSREELVSRVQQAEQLVSVANDSVSYLRMTSSHSVHCVKACAVWQSWAAKLANLGGMRYFLASTIVPEADFASVSAVPTRTATKQQPQRRVEGRKGTKCACGRCFWLVLAALSKSFSNFRHHSRIHKHLVTRCSKSKLSKKKSSL